jgi:hypothetical protein
MLIRPLIALLIILGIVYLVKYIRKQPKEMRPRLLLKYGLYALAIVLILLVLTGRVHWVAAAIGALLPILQRLLFLGMRFMPFLKFWQSHKQQTQGSSAPSSTGKMNLKQAKEIFGLDTIESIEQITKRHRELMQKNHPDRGGSDFLASQINEAKEILIEHFKNA